MFKANSLEIGWEKNLSPDDARYHAFLHVHVHLYMMTINFYRKRKGNDHLCFVILITKF